LVFFLLEQAAVSRGHPRPCREMAIFAVSKEKYVYPNSFCGIDTLDHVITLSVVYRKFRFLPLRRPIGKDPAARRMGADHEHSFGKTEGRMANRRKHGRI